jgi:adenylate cyclase
VAQKQGAAHETVPESTSPQETPSLEVSKKPSIAVLPFANMSGDSDQEHFCDGITEDIIDRLTGR